MQYIYSGLFSVSAALWLHEDSERWGHLPTLTHYIVTALPKGM